jgi:hypothetical protein
VDALETGAADPAVQPAGDLRHGAVGQAGQAPEKLENDSTSRFTQALTETLDAIQEVRAGNRQGFSSAALACAPGSA